ncbi:CRP/FNR family transcriptional regulator, anaerobic regulatory protein [Anaerosphaera aminiphila DSM 21120]|uniref:CRP/FNR family transcriptional regulator, anaerobic regulatory protein n=1 Tax=Anaerosphaera aminiphila DSM 21120 TaxID=1120995 RepID=A0A1M5TCL4_9FIRM|nr:Crp/Fnr family transcriptional regulator [Anaerosphaera aminiphila]SHH48459.1 CRP/FNR family transcriptional regulator, anaerobic regulatory protein [Anaerosphaera aminiphila DSM 21120]
MSKHLFPLNSFFPFWDKLSSNQQEILNSSISEKTFKKSTRLYSGDKECLGLILVRSGTIRAFIVSDSGREITLYRLLQGDICLFSAACIMNSIQFKINLEMEEDVETYILKPTPYEQLVAKSTLISNYTNEIMSSRFSEVMWTLEQILFKSMDSRIAQFLLEQSAMQDTDTLTLTHEQVAKNLGSAREVVTRLLKYFQEEKYVKLTRGKIELLNKRALNKLTE